MHFFHSLASEYMIEPTEKNKTVSEKKNSTFFLSIKRFARSSYIYSRSYHHNNSKRNVWIFNTGNEELKKMNAIEVAYLLYCIHLFIKMGRKIRFNNVIKNRKFGWLWILNTFEFWIERSQGLTKLIEKTEGYDKWFVNIWFGPSAFSLHIEITWLSLLPHVHSLSFSFSFDNISAAHD